MTLSRSEGGTAPWRRRKAHWNAITLARTTRVKNGSTNRSASQGDVGQRRARIDRQPGRRGHHQRERAHEGAQRRAQPRHAREREQRQHAGRDDHPRVGPVHGRPRNARPRPRPPARRGTRGWRGCRPRPPRPRPARARGAGRRRRGRARGRAATTAASASSPAARDSLPGVGSTGPNTIQSAPRSCARRASSFEWQDAPMASDGKARRTSSTESPSSGSCTPMAPAARRGPDARSTTSGGAAAGECGRHRGHDGEQGAAVEVLLAHLHALDARPPAASAASAGSARPAREAPAVGDEGQGEGHAVTPPRARGDGASASSRASRMFTRPSPVTDPARDTR